MIYHTNIHTYICVYAYIYILQVSIYVQCISYGFIMGEAIYSRTVDGVLDNK